MVPGAAAVPLMAYFAEKEREITVEIEVLLKKQN